MNDSELNKEATRLADTHSPHMLAKMLLIESRERVELAAHVEAQNSVLEKASAMGFFTVSYDSGTDHKRLCRKVAALQEDKPSTSLAHRDLIKQAEALESILLITGDDPAHSIRETIAHEVKQLRKQANQLENQ